MQQSITILLVATTIVSVGLLRPTLTMSGGPRMVDDVRRCASPATASVDACLCGCRSATEPRPCCCLATPTVPEAPPLPLAPSASPREAGLAIATCTVQRVTITHPGASSRAMAPPDLAAVTPGLGDHHAERLSRLAVFRT